MERVTSALRVLALVWAISLSGVSGLLNGSPGEAAELSTRTLYLVRHGEYDHDDPRDPEVGRGLVDLGRKQASRVAKRLRELPIRIAALRTSPMTRARETAQEIGKLFPKLNLETDPDLRECTPPTYREDIMRSLETGEGAACQEQLERLFERYFQPSPSADVTEILVCHGNVIRYLTGRAIGLDPKSWLNMTIANCSITVIEVRPDRSIKLFSFGDVGHLPPELQTYAGVGRRYGPPAR